MSTKNSCARFRFRVLYFGFDCGGNMQAEPIENKSGDTWIVLSHQRDSLCKIFTPGEVRPYQNAKYFRVHEHAVADIADFHQLLLRLSLDTSRCLLRGRFIGQFSANALGIHPEKPGYYPRNRALFPDCPQHAVLFDVDKYTPPDGVDPRTKEAVMLCIRELLPAEFHSAGVVWQFSSSAGFGAALKCRLVFWMREPVTTEQWRVWAREHAPGMDQVLFRPMQVHYTSAPVFADGAVDPMAGLERVGYQAGPAVDLTMPADLVLVQSAPKPRPTVPSAKAGLVGAFCRAYSIDAVLDRWLGHVFEREQEENSRRLTYLLSSSKSPGGAFVTDGGDAICNMHDSDPFGTVPANAWDLVREYVYGHLDSEDDRKKDVWKRPSQKEMEHRCMTDVAVQRELLNSGRLAIDAARDDFEDYDAVLYGRPDNFQISPKNLELEGVYPSAVVDGAPAPGIPADGRCAPQRGNSIAQVLDLQSIAEVRSEIGLDVGLAELEIILLKDKNIAGKIWFDELLGDVVAEALPWRNGRTGVVTDADAVGLQLYVRKAYDATVSKLACWDILGRLRDIDSRQPVRDWLRSLQWDGVARLDRVMSEICGCPADAYHAAIFRKFLCAAVRRQFQPGAKFDSMLILVGAQGIGKSTFFRTLLPEHFAENPPPMASEKAWCEWAHGAVICEISELSAMSTAEIEHVRSTISTTHDKFRGAYERKAETRARKFVLTGTTNTEKFARDKERRFWPAHVPRAIDLALLESWRVQLWAEAVALSDEPLYLTGDALAAAQTLQAAAVDDDSGGSAALAAWLDIPLEGGERSFICARDIWVDHLHGRLDLFTAATGRRIGRMMQQCPGWQPGTVESPRWGRQRGWLRDIV